MSSVLKLRGFVLGVFSSVDMCSSGSGVGPDVWLLVMGLCLSRWLSVRRL